MGAEPFRIVNQLREKLSLHAAAIQIPMGLEEKLGGLVDLVTMTAYVFEGTQGEKVKPLPEIPAEFLEMAKEKRHELVETFCHARWLLIFPSPPVLLCLTDLLKWILPLSNFT